VTGVSEFVTIEAMTSGAFGAKEFVAFFDACLEIRRRPRNDREQLSVRQSFAPM